MSMRIHPALKAVVVAVAAGAWLLQAGPSLGAALALGAGAMLVTFAWIRLAPARPAAAAAGGSARSRSDAPPSAPEHDRVLRTAVPRRMPRDVRCTASRATARARRSTRR
jgi:hypothetical protein